MGLSASKIGKNATEKQFHEKNIPTTPIMTPRTAKIISDLDPRSPSANISRTPLEILSAAAIKLQSLEEQNDTPIRTKQFELGEDPRSPTADFTRTPIVLNADEKVSCKALHVRNLDKIKLANMSSTEDTPKRTKSPVLLDTTLIKHRQDSCKRKSHVGLLETNIDFTETDLDEVQTKYMIIPEENKFSCNDKDQLHDTNLDDLKIDIVEHKDSSIEQAGSENQILDEATSDHNLIIIDSSIIDSDKEDEISSPEVRDMELEDESEVCIKTNSLERNMDNVDPDFIEEDNELIVEITKDCKSVPVTPPSSIVSNKEIKSAPGSPPVVNVTATVKELDQKLTNLIYEDDIVVCPRIVKLKEPIERSPLRNRNINEPLKLQKLKVSDKPRRSDYVVSKIPIFKENGKKEIQCENTPPRKSDMRRGKVKKCNWDNTDTTLYL